MWMIHQKKVSGRGFNSRRLHQRIHDPSGLSPAGIVYTLFHLENLFSFLIFDLSQEFLSDFSFSELLLFSISHFFSYFSRSEMIK
jgi:hypothetical protein